MPRIVAGWAGSLQLAVPPDGTRPTSDRTREAIFSMLEARDAIEGAAVVDLYAGSGALGLEAMSRGAASVVLVEKAPRAAKVIRDNVGRMRKAAPGPFDATVVQQSTSTWLGSAAPGIGLAFLDPPYSIPDAQVAGDLAALVPLLTPDAVVLLERAARSGDPVLPPGLELVRSRSKGDTAVHLLVPEGS